VAGQSFCRAVRSFHYFRHGVANSKGESSAVHYRNMWKIITDTSDSRICNARPSKDLFLTPSFSLFHMDKFHIHLVGAAKERLSRPAMQLARRPAVWARVRPCPSCALIVSISSALPSAARAG